MTPSGRSSGAGMAEAAPPPAPPAKGLRAALGGLLLAAAVGALVGAAFETLRPAFREARGANGAQVPSEPSTIFDIPPIVTNLGAPDTTWIRLEGSIVFDPRTLPHPEAVAAMIGGDTLAFLRTVTLKQLEGPVGLQSIREDLNERAATRSGGRVREFVIRTLVVQ
jgi:flagellar protein FliL